MEGRGGARIETSSEWFSTQSSKITQLGELRIAVVSVVVGFVDVDHGDKYGDDGDKSDVNGNMCVELRVCTLSHINTKKTCGSNSFQAILLQVVTN